MTMMVKREEENEYVTYRMVDQSAIDSVQITRYIYQFKKNGLANNKISFMRKRMSIITCHLVVNI